MRKRRGPVPPPWRTPDSIFNTSLSPPTRVKPIRRRRCKARSKAPEGLHDIWLVPLRPLNEQPGQHLQQAQASKGDRPKTVAQQLQIHATKNPKQKKSAPAIVCERWHEVQAQSWGGVTWWDCLLLNSLSSAFWLPNLGCGLGIRNFVLSKAF